MRLTQYDEPEPAPSSPAYRPTTATAHPALLRQAQRNRVELAVRRPECAGPHVGHGLQLRVHPVDLAGLARRREQDHVRVIPGVITHRVPGPDLFPDQPGPDRHVHADVEAGRGYPVARTPARPVPDGDGTGRARSRGQPGSPVGATKV